MFTDSKSLFYALTKASYLEEERLMIYNTCELNGIQKEEITNILFLRTENSPADALTKITSSKSLTMVFLENI